MDSGDPCSLEERGRGGRGVGLRSGFPSLRAQALVLARTDSFLSLPLARRVRGGAARGWAREYFVSLVSTGESPKNHCDLSCRVRNGEARRVTSTRT